MPEEESTDEEQVDQFDSASEGEDDLLETLTNNVRNLDEAPFFCHSFVEIRLINQD